MPQPLRILVVDDERISRETTKQQLVDAGYVAQTAADAGQALEAITSGTFDVVLTDLRMPGTDGQQLLEAIKRQAQRTDVIVMTAYGSIETAVSAMRAGAADYLTKPFRFAELELRLGRLAQVRRSQEELVRLRSLLEETTFKGLVGRSAAMAAVCERIRLFSDSDVPVLITGETGTGKEVVARVVHEASARRERPFVALACGAIPGTLAEAHLFGHERGAFTGATQRRRGAFEQADGGTLLLDDIDDLPLDLQVKLLRVLQDGIVVRLGGEAPVATAVRVVATTKVDLAEAVAEGTFRSDLYYRLRGFELALPPLRERGDDIVLLARYFLQLQGSATRCAPKALDASAVSLLRAHPWPGNVRELRRVIEAAVALCPGDTIGTDHLPEGLGRGGADSAPFSLNLDAHTGVDLAALVRSFEEQAIRWAMRRADGSQSRAAKLLGLPRTSLQSKLGRTGQRS